jgi:hypothetical protein
MPYLTLGVLRRFSVPLLLTPRLRYHPGSRLSHARQSVLDDRGVPSLLSLRHGTEQRGQEPKAQNRFLTPLSDPESVPDPFVYGKGEKLDLDENDPLNPLTAYARSKIETEQAVSRLADDSSIDPYIA